MRTTAAAPMLGFHIPTQWPGGLNHRRARSISVMCRHPTWMRMRHRRTCDLHDLSEPAW